MCWDWVRKSIWATPIAIKHRPGGGCDEQAPERSEGGEVNEAWDKGVGEVIVSGVSAAVWATLLKHGEKS